MLGRSFGVMPCWQLVAQVESARGAFASGFLFDHCTLTGTCPSRAAYSFVSITSPDFVSTAYVEQVPLREVTKAILERAPCLPRHGRVIRGSPRRLATVPRVLPSLQSKRKPPPPRRPWINPRFPHPRPL